MINEYTYVTGMVFISWVVAIFMLIGFIAVKTIKSDSEDDNKDDTDKLMSEAFMNQFYSKSFSDKVLSIMQYGAIMSALIFTTIFKIKKKGDNKK